MSSCLIIVGEKSGEEHALTFLPQLIKENPQYKFWGVGGDRMSREGVELHYHFKEFSHMGFDEVFKSLPFYIRAFRNIITQCRQRKTSVAILVDYQTFNLKLAKKLKRQGIKVLYYVAPQAWAWKSYRAQQLKKYVDELYCILPFEKKWFAERGVHHTVSLQHPLFHEYQKALPEKKEHIAQKKYRILLLPGSRAREVRGLLPLFQKVITQVQKNVDISLDVAVAQVDHLEEHLYQGFSPEQRVQQHQLPQAMQEADFCLAASGTVTLMSALFLLPTIICYQGTLLEEFVFTQVLKYQKPISLPNLIAQDWVLPEYLQYHADVFTLSHHVMRWINSPVERNRISHGLEKIRAQVASGEKNSCLAMKKYF